MGFWSDRYTSWREEYEPPQTTFTGWSDLYEQQRLEEKRRELEEQRRTLEAAEPIERPSFWSVARDTLAGAGRDIARPIQAIAESPEVSGLRSTIARTPELIGGGVAEAGRLLGTVNPRVEERHPGVVRVLSAPGRAVEEMGATLEEMGSRASEQEAEATQERQQEAGLSGDVFSDIKESPWRAIREHVGHTAGSLGGSILTTAAGGMLPGSMALGVGEQYHRARAEGQERGEALVEAGPTGAVIGALERTGLEKILDSRTASWALPRLRKGLESMVAEGLTEGAQGLVSELGATTRRIAQGDADAGALFELFSPESLRQYGAEAFLGGLAGGAASIALPGGRQQQAIPEAEPTAVPPTSTEFGTVEIADPDVPRETVVREPYRATAQEAQEAPEGVIPTPTTPETVTEAPAAAQGQEQAIPETPRSRLDIPPPAEATGIVGQEMLPTISSPLEATPRERASQFVRRWLTSRKGLSEDVFQAVESKGAKMAAAKIASLDKANALRRATAGYLKQSPDVDPDAFTDAINARLEGRDPEIPLPKVVDQLAGKMREDVDALTRTMIDEGMVSESMAETFQENLGQYLTRTYWAFDDPKHVQRLKESGDWDRLKRELREIPEFAQLDEARLEGEMERIATRNAEDFFSGAGLGTQETGIYKRRKSIPRQIRELMGEEFDPATRYFKSVERMSRNVETFRMYDALATLGAREGWVHDKPVRGHAREIPGKGTARDPLGGKFTNKEMYNLITGANEQAHSGFMTQMARRVVGWSREALTVHSPQTQARNVEANFLLMMAGGNLGARWKPWGKGDETLGVVKAAKEFKERGTQSGKKILKLAEEVGLDDLTPAELAGMYGRAAQLGLTGTNVDLGIVKDLLESSDRLHGDKRGRNPLSAARRFNRKLYEAGDVVFKLAAWRSETAKQRWAKPELTAGEQEARAAKIVQDTMPNYSRLLGIFDKYRTNPVLGNFISFYSEIPRNVVNQTRTGLQELREGAQTGNKRQMIVGADRLTGTLAALSTPFLLKAAAGALSGDDAPDEEEEDAIRPLLPPWMRYGQHIVMNVKDGKATVVDLSFMDPMTQIKEPVIAAIKTGGVDPSIMDRVFAAAETYADPYTQVGLAPKAAIESLQGRTMEGRELYPETAPLGIKAKRTREHLGKTFLPGAVRAGERLGKAGTGYIEPWGRTYETGHELLALVGPRVYTIDVGEALKFEAGDYAESFRSGRAEVNRLESWQKAMGRAGKMVPAGKREEAERVAEASYREGLEGLVEVVNAARKLGLSDGRIFNVLDDSGLSKEDARRAVLSARAVEQGMPWDDVYERFIRSKYGDQGR